MMRINIIGILVLVFMGCNEKKAGFSEKEMEMKSATVPDNFTERIDWNKQFKWFKDNLERFTKYFKLKVAKL
jgi:hypothetical protein